MERIAPAGMSQGLRLLATALALLHAATFVWASSCGEMKESGPCNQDSNCLWVRNETEGYECRQSCVSFLTEGSCVAQPHCAINGGAQEFACVTNCGEIHSELTCGVATDCHFDVASATCRRRCAAFSKASCPSPECNATATSSSTTEHQCVDSCLGYSPGKCVHETVKERCVALLLDRQQHECAPRCEMFVQASVCPAHCLHDAVSGDCEPDCGEIAKESCSATTSCLWVSDAVGCVKRCSAESSESSCMAHQHCRWEAAVSSGPGSCLTNCEMLLVEEDCADSCQWFRGKCVPSCAGFSTAAACPAITCIATNTTSASAEHQCIIRCANFHGDRARCVAMPSCDYALSGHCNIRCSALTHAPCDQDELGGRCLTSSSSPSTQCETSCVALTEEADCRGSRDCLWGEEPAVCTPNICSGNAATCATSNDNCWWNPRNRQCLRRCSTVTNTSESCEGIPGCVLDELGGEPETAQCVTRCTHFSRAQCTSVDGCIQGSLSGPNPCIADCSKFDSASKCDRSGGKCVWNGESCQNRCSDLDTGAQCRAAAACSWLPSQCSTTCSMLQTRASCAASQCVWNGSQCFDSCASLPVVDCASGSTGDARCVMLELQSGSSMCALNCSDVLSHSQCRGLPHCELFYSSALLHGDAPVYFCRNKCHVFPADACPSAFGCATRNIGSPSNPNLTCAVDCMLPQMQNVHMCNAELNSCQFFGAGSAHASACRPSCSAFATREWCPDYCVPAGWSKGLESAPQCRPRCIVAATAEACDALGDFCTFDHASGVCRDSCEAVAFAGLSVSENCSATLPYCIARPSLDSFFEPTPACTINCSLGGERNCGVGSFTMCRFNPLTNTCVDACERYRRWCPTPNCVPVNTTDSFSPICVYNCSQFSERDECARMPHYCVWLEAESRCDVSCGRLARLPAGEVPAHCQEDHCTGATPCHSNCSFLGEMSCVGVPHCSWTGTHCARSCELLQTALECDAQSYCDIQCRLIAPQPVVPAIGHANINGAPFPESSHTFPMSPTSSDTPEATASPPAATSASPTPFPSEATAHAATTTPAATDPLPPPVTPMATTVAPAATAIEPPPAPGCTVDRSTIVSQLVFEGSLPVFQALVSNGDSLKEILTQDLTLALAFGGGSLCDADGPPEVLDFALGSLHVNFSVTAQQDGPIFAQAFWASLQENVNAFVGLHHVYDAVAAQMPPSINPAPMSMAQVAFVEQHSAPEQQQPPPPPTRAGGSGDDDDKRTTYIIAGIAGGVVLVGVAIAVLHNRRSSARQQQWEKVEMGVEMQRPLQVATPHGQRPSDNPFDL